jgi:GMP synthase (glutamine-hydrolysing)
MKRPVLLYVLGSAPEPVARAHGDFPHWFAALWRDQPVDVTVFDGVQPRAMPPLRGFAGVVLTGSPASMTDPEPWMEIAVEFVRDAARHGTPVLGVCFGHQLIGAAYGGSVVRNPAGPEHATGTIELTSAGRADPLFDGVPDRFDANLSHWDALEASTLSPANGIRVLAANDRTGAQAIAGGDAIRGVQFHPEFSGAIARAYVEAHRAVLAASADDRGAPDDHPDSLSHRARDTPAAVQVFSNFTRHWIFKA